MKMRLVSMKRRVGLRFREKTSNERITGDVGNAALIVLVSTHPDVAMIAPRRTPGVLSDVIIFLRATVVESVIANNNK